MGWQNWLKTSRSPDRGGWLDWRGEERTELMRGAGRRGAPAPLLKEGAKSQSRVISATAFLAHSSSTRVLPALAAAMSAAMAALFSARGRPRLA